MSRKGYGWGYMESRTGYSVTFSQENTQIYMKIPGIKTIPGNVRGGVRGI